MNGINHDATRPTIIRLGLGEVSIDTGTHHDIPAVFIEPVDVAGPVGERAPARNLHSVVPGSTIIELHGDPRVLIEAVSKAYPLASDPDLLVVAKIAQNLIAYMLNARDENGRVELDRSETCDLADHMAVINSAIAKALATPSDTHEVG